MYRTHIKPTIDFFSALVGLLCLSPAIALFIVLLLIANRGTPFFFHERPGKNGKLFKIIKFKTMNDRKDAEGNLLPGDQRITKIGGFLRKFSLDEMLQLVNVLVGDMSLVGPRPLEVAYLPLYTEEQSKRHEVKPGVTGWAQVNGRNALSWEERFKLDVWYVDNVSFSIDIKVLWKTIFYVLKREGTEHIPPFKGSF